MSGVEEVELDPVVKATRWLVRTHHHDYGLLDEEGVERRVQRQVACVNPNHLEPVTPRINVLRGVSHIADQVTRTHCPKGHPYAEGNLHLRPSGRRACKACAREWSADRLRRIRSGEHTVTPRKVA